MPTARYDTFDALEIDAALAYLETLPGPWVVKTDGLAAGKGVLVARTIEEARDDVTAKLTGASFGDAGRHIVIEEGLVGEECSLLVLCDGTRAVPLIPAQDFKRIGDGDTGPNTGGMGCLRSHAAVSAPHRRTASWRTRCCRSSASCGAGASTTGACSMPG